MKFNWNIANLPTWFLLELDDAKIPRDFEFDDLSDYQITILMGATDILELVEKGNIEVRIDPETNHPEYKVKGTKMWIGWVDTPEEGRKDEE